MLEVISIQSPGQQEDVAGRFLEQGVSGLFVRPVYGDRDHRALTQRMRLLEQSGVDWSPAWKFLRALSQGDKVGMKHAYADSIRKNKGKFGLYEQLLNPMDEGTNADGGYTVPQEWASMVQATIWSRSVFVSKLAPYHVKLGKVANVPTLAGLPSVVWVDENNAITASKTTFGTLQLTLKKCATIVPITEELLEDTNVDILAFITRTVGASFALEYDTQIARGTGTPWTGLLGLTTATYVQGGSTTSGKLGYDDITWDDLISAPNVLKPIYQAGSEYYIDQNVWTVLLKLKDSQSNYLYGGRAELAKGLGYVIDKETNSVRWMFNGFPVNVMPGDTSGTTGVMIATYDTANHATTKHALFGNLFETAWWATKNGLKAAFGTEATLDGVNLFANDLQAVRWTERVAFGCGLPLQLCAIITSTT